MDEVESDFSVFHRVDDVHQLESSRFFKLAERLPFYQGAVRGRMEAMQNIELASTSSKPGMKVAKSGSEILEFARKGKR
jgi:hypothetical protein